MYGFEHAGAGWFWPGVISSALLWALLAVAIVVGVRYLTRRPRPWGEATAHPVPPGPYAAPGAPAAPPAEGILAGRFARGEIDEEEYRRRLATLRGDGPGQTPGPGGQAAGRGSPPPAGS